MFSRLGIFPEFLARNDNQDRIEDVVNVKIGANSHSTPSISLSDLISASPIGSGSGSRLFMALWCHQKFSMFFMPTQRYIDGLKDDLLAIVLLLKVDDILDKFLTSGDCHFLFILFLKFIFAMESSMLMAAPSKILYHCILLPTTSGVLSRLKGKKNNILLGATHH